MRRFLRWLLGVPEAVSIDFLHTVDQRLDDAEDSIAHFDRRFIRLQQQVTRWSRDVDTHEEEDDEEDEDTEFERLLAERRNQRG